MTRNGFMYIYVSNETGDRDVFFDNLSIQHTTGPITEETHYYPFGLTMAGISSKALKPLYIENDKKYNGIELEDDMGLNVYDAQLRELDPQMGRWWQIDPKTENMEMWSPYASNYDNPIRYNDFLGNEPQCCGFLIDLAKNGITFVSGATNAWASNQMLGAGRKDVDEMGGLTPTQKAYAKAGQLTGDVLSIVTGGAQVGGAIVGEIASVGIATPIAIPFALQGASSAVMGVTNIIKGLSTPTTEENSILQSTTTTPQGRNSNKLTPDPDAQGDHTTFKRDQNGNIYKWEEWRVNPQNPTGFDTQRRFDGGKADGSPGAPHTNKKTKEQVPTPHIQGKDIPGGVSPATPDELPDNNRFKPKKQN